LSTYNDRLHQNASNLTDRERYLYLLDKYKILQNKYRGLSHMKRINEGKLNATIIGLNKKLSGEKLFKMEESVPVIKRIKTIIETDLGIILEAKTRKREYIYARCHFYILAHKYTDSALKTIGYEIGGRDHSTIIHGLKTAQDLIDTDKVFRADQERYDQMVIDNIITDRKI
jgi:hypothetical protein